MSASRAASALFRRTLLTTPTRRAPASAVPRILATARSRSPPVHTTQKHCYARMADAPAANDGGVHNLAKQAEWDDALSQKGLLVLDCFATWCGPCKMIAPKVVEFSKQYKDVRFYKVDVDELPDLAQELGIRAMPTFLLFKDGEKVSEVVGANPNAIKAAIEKNL